MASATPTRDQIARIHAYGGIALHDVATVAELAARLKFPRAA